MRRIRYSVAMSLDGFIAGPSGEADWITMDPEIDFAAIFSEFDTVLLGSRTYLAMAAAGRGSLPGMQTLVFSRTLRQADHPNVTIVAEYQREALLDRKASAGKDIWLFGGGTLFGALAGEGLVDTVEVAVMPILLGEGVPLFPAGPGRIGLKLTAHKLYPATGIVALTYAIRGAGQP